MELTPEQVADLQSKAAKADEFEARLKENESKAKGYDEVKADMLRYKGQLAEQQSEREKAERAKLEEQGQYKTLLEKAESEKLALVKKAEDSESLASRFIRANALKEEAAKAGILPAALSDLLGLATEDLEIQRNGNEIFVKGAAERVAETKKTRPHWFSTNASPRFDAGRGGNINTDGESLTELQKRDPGKYRERLKAIVAGQAK